MKVQRRLVQARFTEIHKIFAKKVGYFVTNLVFINLPLWIRDFYGTCYNTLPELI
jgi:hypothetical protein